MTEIHKLALITGTVLAMLAVISGAFGAHALKKTRSEEMLIVYKTAVDYQFFHALGMIFIGLLMLRSPDNGLLIYAALIMFAGILLFSGSLYALSITGIKPLGMITPIGGFALIIAWLFMAVGIYKM